MDAVVDADGRVQILEVNVSPGLTDTSLLPTAGGAAGHWTWAPVTPGSSTGRSRAAESPVFHVEHARRP